MTGFASDRKDFYHQFRISDERARANSLPFSFTLEEFGALGIKIDGTDSLGRVPLLHEPVLTDSVLPNVPR